MLSCRSMDPFVRRLVQRMLDPRQPLTRNRHFHTFSTPEGRAALRATRRLRSLQSDLEACAGEGHSPTFIRHDLEDGNHRIELVMQRVHGRRTSLLQPAEFELLLELPGVRALLQSPAAGPSVPESAVDGSSS